MKPDCAKCWECNELYLRDGKMYCLCGLCGEVAYVDVLGDGCADYDYEPETEEYYAAL